MTDTALPVEVVRGIALMVLAMAFLALSDLSIKLAAQSMNVGQAMTLISVGGTAMFVAIARAQNAPLFTPGAFRPLVLVRNLLEVVGAVGMVLGVAFVPLSTFAAVIQTAPLVVIAGAALILREPVGARRWTAVAVGFVGMLLVVRPGMEGFVPASLFAVMGITALGVRDVVTRLIPPGLPTVTISAWGFAATIPTGPLLMAVMGTPPEWQTAGLLSVAAAVATLVCGYYAVTTATRIAPASSVAPFRYTRLVFTTGLGIAVFGERPDALTLVGAAIILGSGLYVFVRERQLARRHPVTPTTEP